MHPFLSLLNYFKFSRTLNWAFTCSGPSDSRSRQMHLSFLVPITRLCYCADKNKESLIANTISKLHVFLTCFPKSLNVHYIHQRKLPFKQQLFTHVGSLKSNKTRPLAGVFPDFSIQHLFSVWTIQACKT